MGKTGFERGGLRAVPPTSPAQWQSESEPHEGPILSFVNAAKCMSLSGSLADIYQVIIISMMIISSSHHRLLPRRGFPRPVPELVLVANHRTAAGISKTGFAPLQPRPVGRRRTCFRQGQRWHEVARTVGRSLLVAMGRAHAAVHVVNDPFRGMSLMNQVDPSAAKAARCGHVLLGGRKLHQEASRLVGGSGLSIDALPP